MRVLSLFDGMSCGQIALERAGIKVDKYYASEIDKYAIQITQKNYPDTIQLGDVTKWHEWDLPKIDLILAGSPCQGFSFAGKQLAFDDPRSKLFFDFVDIKNHYKPANFLLENVRMKQLYQDIMSAKVMARPVKINSSLVSAQNRERLYWSSIDDIEQPEDLGIVLADIVEGGVVDRDKSYCLDANYFKGGNLKSYFEKRRRQLVFDPEYLDMDKFKFIAANKKSKSGLIFKGGIITTKFWLDNGKFLSRNFPQGNRVYCSLGKASNLNALGGGMGAKTGLYMFKDGVRKLTPIECERLQTVPDNYTEGVSNTQRYKMLGNGWTVDVIAHILKGLNKTIHLTY
jgi:site-specific DNA-cytosine methylase